MAVVGENTVHAWCQLEQSGNHSCRDSYNVASVTDMGVGRTKFTFSSNAVNNDYVWVGNSGNHSNTTTSARTVNNDGAMTTSQFSIRNIQSTSGANDDTMVNIIVVSDG